MEHNVLCKCRMSDATCHVPYVDAQSTDGTEPSHMHTESELHAPNFNRGYE